MAKSRFFAVVITGLVLALIFGGGAAVGAKMITGKQIKNGTVSTKDIKDGAVHSKDIKDGAVHSEDIKDGGVHSVDIKDGTVASRDLAPGAVAFPNSLWSTQFRNQTGAAESNVQSGPGGSGQLNDGSLRLFTSTPTDVAAFGNSFEFAGVRLDQINHVEYSTYNPEATPKFRPTLRIEINPHLVNDATFGGATEFTTLIHEPGPGTTGWMTNANALGDDAWRLTGEEGDVTGCNTVTQCTFAQVLAALQTHADPDTAPPAISTGIYFGLGAEPVAPIEAAVDRFVLNSYVFDFEPMGVFVTPVS
jgi:hypothetical protein